ncbi:WD40/YVTN/BNR-like repeat-containing protein [Ralstonia soli]|uniref:YCF48-related protein n=1 Tax=Ralstonia soli TaxID=2953896 RepID=A0ABT1AEC3_9RALS|nr:YCF48-related protein [Ralstonia soli]MCO5396726.1 YCF48-related protein [Ralstonia soli]
MTTRAKANRFVTAFFLLLGSGFALASAGDARPVSGTAAVRIRAAEPSPSLDATQILASTTAGQRIVAVGDHGVVMLSDDSGLSFRQASSVPADTTLTSVSFVDRDHGWAVGHGGVIIQTSDGGEHWTLQRKDVSVDQPLLGVYFKDRQNGWAVGLWSLMLETKDGGMNWLPVKPPIPPGAKKADRNFFSIFGDGRDGIYISCEQGLVLRSTDGGAVWSYVETGYQGSLWAGLALPDGTLLVGGLRGNIYRSDDHGVTWTHSATDFTTSVTGFSVDHKGAVFASAVDGVVFESGDDGRTFQGHQRSGRESLTAVTATSSGKVVLFSQSGPIK